MKAVLTIESADAVRALLGIRDRNTRLFRSELGVTVTVRSGELQFEGEEAAVEAAQRIAAEAMERFARAGHLGEDEVALLLRASGARAEQEAGGAGGEALLRTRSNRAIAPRTSGQRAYVRALEQSEVVFAIGPAGTGKTYLAVAMAVSMLRAGAVKRLILTRPVVEAGERLGFLPGTFEAKINPYLRPLYDALYDMLDPAQLRKFAENDVIEIAPLAYMRGRTLADAFIILDEAQNTTIGQMKMFLTRMGEGSRMVVTGDVTQVDLARPAQSGLIHASRILHDVRGVRFSTFDRSDIVRHAVVERIVAAYEKKGRH